MDLNALAKNLKFFRKAHGYTQEDLGKLLNIQRQSYCNYENARRSPSIEFLIDIAELYDITLDMLISPQEQLYSDASDYSITQLLTDYLSLPDESQREVQSFISYLKSKNLS